jgi:hypothetical protein
MANCTGIEGGRCEVSYLYGRTTRVAEENAPALRQAGEPPQQAVALAQRIAALIPADILAIHAIVLAIATEKANDGTTTVTNASLLKWSFPLLASLGILLYAIGKLPNWSWSSDAVRMIIPVGAYFAWTLLTGSSGAILWKWFSGLTGGWEFLVAGVLGAILLAIAARFTPT